MYYLHSVLVKQLATEHRVSVIRTWPPELTDPDGGASTRSSPGPTPAVSSSPPLFRVMTRGIAGPCQLLRMRNIEVYEVLTLPVRSIEHWGFLSVLRRIEVSCLFCGQSLVEFWPSLSILWSIYFGKLTFPVHSLDNPLWNIDLSCPFPFYGQFYMKCWRFGPFRWHQSMTS